MEELYGWIKNITYYLIFMTVVSAILPDKKYEKYIKLFAGMVLVLLVLKPVTQGLRVEDKIAYYFNTITLQKEAAELQDEISAMDKKRLEKVIEGYEKAVAHDLEVMAEGAGFVTRDVNVALENDKESQTFGMVTQIQMILNRQKEEGEKEKNSGETMGGIERIPEVEQVPPVTFGENIPSVSRDVRISEDTAVNKLRRQISEYYSLEEEHIEIQLEDE